MLRPTVSTTTYSRLRRAISGSAGAATDREHDDMMGVPLEGAAAGALKLHNAGLIDYVLARVRVLNRPGLEKRTCEAMQWSRKNTTGCFPIR